jgi:hypothetical protein
VEALEWEGPSPPRANGPTPLATALTCASDHFLGARGAAL